MRSHVGCGTVQHNVFLHVSQIFERCKKPCKKTGFLNLVKFDMSSPIYSQNNKDQHRGIMHLWAKFGDPSLRG